MKSENIIRFNELASSDAKIQAKLKEIYANSAHSKAEKIAALSAETDAPFTAEEFLASLTPRNELSDAELEAVSGGLGGGPWTTMTTDGSICPGPAVNSTYDSGGSQSCGLGTNLIS